MSRRRSLPLVYSCSGCSSAAQLANELAVRLDREGEAEMSCIAGVGGNVPNLVKVARSGRPIIAIDGCALECARHCLAERGVAPTVHVQLAEHGVRKRYHEAFDPQDGAPLLTRLRDLARGLVRPTPRADEAGGGGDATGRPIAATRRG